MINFKMISNLNNQINYSKMFYRQPNLMINKFYWIYNNKVPKFCHRLSQIILKYNGKNTLQMSIKYKNKKDKRLC